MTTSPWPSLSVTVFVAALANPVVSMARGPQEGVRCPDGFEVTIGSDNRSLICGRPFTLKSICSPIAFSSKGLKVSGNIVMDSKGSDRCLAVATGSATASVMEPPRPGYPAPGTFKRVVDANGPDRFVAPGREFAFPVDGPDYLIGDRSKGVRCPAGYDGDRRFNGRGIRCDKWDGPARAADCDFGWTLRVDDQGGKEDRCLGVNQGPTKPKGMTKVHHDADRALPTVGWVLDKRTGPDTWRRKVYAYPSHVN